MTEWPTFRNAWSLNSILWGTEITTIFLNLQWFGKYFNKPKLERISKLLFTVLWFPIRVQYKPSE